MSKKNFLPRSTADLRSAWSFTENKDDFCIKTLWYSVVLFIVFCLSMTLLFTGCKMDDDELIDDHKLNSALIGTWADSTGGDGYTITADHLSYNSGYSNDYAGTIKYISNFSATAGVIIIEYDTDSKPLYFDWTQTPPTPLPLRGDFIGIYYHSLRPGISVRMGGAYEGGGAEKASLDAAIKAFTMGNEGTYMTFYGTYSKQP